MLIAACGTIIGNISLLQVMAVKSLSVIVGKRELLVLGNTPLVADRMLYNSPRVA